MGWPLFEEVCMPNHPAKSNGPLGDVTYNMPPASASGLSPILDRNIEALVRRRNQERQSQSWEARIADAITGFAGSMLFVYLHLCDLWLMDLCKSALDTRHSSLRRDVCHPCDGGVC